MNTFTGLKPEENDTIEINNPKDLKKYQKKLKYKKERLNKCDCPNQTEKLFDEIRIIEVEIDEYLNRNKGVPVKKCKPKPEVKQEFVFDEAENRNFNEKRSREIREKEESERKAREQEREKNSKFWDEWKKRSESWDREENARKAKREADYQKYKQQRQEQRNEQEEYKKPFNLNEFIKECGLKLKDVPKDIKNLYYDFSMKKYKILSRNYHPDKSSGKQEYMIILNGIRDHHNPNNLGNDETWIK